MHARRLLTCLALGLLLPVHGVLAADSTTVLLVRHAEKASATAGDPHLSTAGRARARALAHVAGASGAAAIFVTQYKRTQETGKPLATMLQLTPIEHPAADTPALLADIQANWLGKTVVVCGHSNTLPDVIKRLTGIALGDIPDGQYDNLYVVVLPPNGPPSLTHLKYGAATP